jgi:hypothetical protein
MQPGVSKEDVKDRDELLDLQENSLENSITSVNSISSLLKEKLMVIV